MENNYQTFDLAVILSRSIARSHQIVAGDINPINDRSLTQLQELVLIVSQTDYMKTHCLQNSVTEVQKTKQNKNSSSKGHTIKYGKLLS